MKGVVFNLLEDAVTREYGEDVWDELLRMSGLHGAYTSLGSYPDAELTALVDVASKTLKVPAADVVRWFGRQALPALAMRYPAFFEPHRSARSFILTLNDIIHPEVRKLYPQASVPDFAFEGDAPRLRLIYRSPKKMCAFAEGLIEGAAAHYGESVSLSQPECMLRGDPRCVIACEFS